jgi:copper chaperone CopZ
MIRLMLRIEGMTCDHCVRGLRRELSALPSVVVERVEVGRVALAHDGSRLTGADLSAAVSHAGYRLAGTEVVS